MLKFLAFVAIFLTSIGASHEVKPVTPELAEEYELDREFLKKGTMAMLPNASAG